jgi:hypothetical protein
MSRAPKQVGAWREQQRRDGARDRLLAHVRVAAAAARERVRPVGIDATWAAMLPGFVHAGEAVSPLR